MWRILGTLEQAQQEAFAHNFLGRLGIRVGLAIIVYVHRMTVCLVIFLPKIPCVHRIYMVLANLRYVVMFMNCCCFTLAIMYLHKHLKKGMLPRVVLLHSVLHRP